jgi:low temperature requirement protein LtrA
VTTGQVQRSGRKVHWLELFFDLVIVAYIGQIAHTMHGDPSWIDAVAFVGFLAAAWWAWVNATITLNLFGARVTASIWISVTIAMVAIGVMAAAVPDALGNRADAFAVGNALIRIIWAVPWFMNRRTIGFPWWRSALYCGVPAVVWLVSTVAAPPWQYVLWAVAVAIEVVLLSPLGSQQDLLRDALDVDHLAERVGLLVVIVFGESILTIIAELDSHWVLPSGVTAVLGFAAVAMLAWIYFTHAASAVERGLQRLKQRGSVGAIRDTVMYLPFLLVTGVTLFAAALGTAVADAARDLPQGAVIALSAGISLFFAASAAQFLRYGLSWREVAGWAPVAILLPWALVPLSRLVTAEAVVVASVGVVAIALVLVALTARRDRGRALDATP